MKNIKKMSVLFVLVLCIMTFASCSKEEPEPVTPTGSEKEKQDKTSTQDVTETPDPVVTTDPTYTPDPTDTPAPTATPMPTATPTPVPTEEPVVTGKAAGDVDSDDNPVVTGKDGSSIITDNDNGNTDDTILPVDIVYHQFKGTDRPLSALGGKLAQRFVNAFYTYDAEDVISILAYDGSHMDEVDEIYVSFEQMQESFGSLDEISSLLNVEIIGGETIDLEENLEAVQYGALVDVESTCTDLEVFTASISTNLYGLEDYGKSYLNIIVGKYEGEYKVINTRIVKDTENADSGLVDPDNFNATPTPTPMPIDYSELLYKFKGNETADDIAKLFADSYMKFDMITMFSCIAMDDETLQKSLGELDSSILEMESLSEFLNENALKITLGEAEDVSDEELEKLKPKTTQVDWADVSDMVKYTMHIEMTVFDQTQNMDSYLYIGKYKGEYRIINADIFDEY